MSIARHQDLIERIDALLPQTQCRRCGYPACRPYAEAIAEGTAPINRCAPGGMQGVHALARVTGHAVQPLDPEYGQETPPQAAFIDEEVCIGCTKCIQACPVDAIVGARKVMHTVVADLCTGCELCLPPCPVDCIAMVPVAAASQHARGVAARARFLARNDRLAREREAPDAPHAPRAGAAPAAPARTIAKSEVLAAIARGRARRRQRSAS